MYTPPSLLSAVPHLLCVTYCICLNLSVFGLCKTNISRHCCRVNGPQTRSQTLAPQKRVCVDQAVDKWGSIDRWRGGVAEGVVEGMKGGRGLTMCPVCSRRPSDDVALLIHTRFFFPPTAAAPLPASVPCGFPGVVNPLTHPPPPCYRPEQTLAVFQLSISKCASAILPHHT